MIFGPDDRRIRAQLSVWWTIWFSLLCGLCLIYFVMGHPLPPAVPAANPFANLVGLVPLFVSIIIRWLVLPRFSDFKRAFYMFVAGLTLAESCGILGIFMGGPYRDSLFVLGLLGIAQFMPFFAKQYLNPKPRNFIPNN